MLGFTQPYRVRFILFVTIIIIASVLSPLLPLFIQKTIDGPIASNDEKGLTLYLIGMLCLVLASSLLTYTNTFLAGWLGQKIINDIRIQLYERLLQLQLTYFDQTPVGKLVTRIISDIETLSDVFSAGFASIIGDLLLIFSIVGLMLYIDWKLALVAISTIPLLAISTIIFKIKIKKTFNIVRNAVAEFNAFIQENITGIGVVQAFAAEQKEFKKFERLNRNHRKANIQTILYYSIYFPVADIISALGIGMIIWYGSKGMIEQKISFGVITAFIMYINQLFRPIRLLADRINTLQLGLVSISRIFEILDDKKNVETSGDKKLDIEGAIIFDKVKFSYKTDEWVLNGISFRLEEGQSMAIVGTTGAGKTSIISLINRFYEIQSGNIKINEINIQEWDLATLRKQIGVVLQDVFLFSGSIEENIRLGNEGITLTQIIESAKLIGAHEFIKKLPGGYQYQVQERGLTLSVGQRQLIAFVRTMIQKPKILVLDEATSSIDAESEKLVQFAIQKVMKKQTSIIIAHRLSTIRNVDHILYLEKGHIIEQGTHEELLEKGGAYQQLYQMQFKKI